MNKRRKIKLSFLFGIVFFKDPEGVRIGQLFRRFTTSHYNAYKQDS